MGIFEKIFKNFELLTISAKSFILDLPLGSEYASHVPSENFIPIHWSVLTFLSSWRTFFLSQFFFNLKNFQAFNLKFLFWDAWLVFLIALHATRPKAGVFETMSTIIFIIDVRQDDTYASAGNETFHLWEFSFNWFLITFWLLTHSFPMHSFSDSWNYQKIVRFSDVFKE